MADTIDFVTSILPVGCCGLHYQVIGMRAFSKIFPALGTPTAALVRDGILLGLPIYGRSNQESHARYVTYLRKLTSTLDYKLWTS